MQQASGAKLRAPCSSRELHCRRGVSCFAYLNSQEGTMGRERVLKIVLLLAGLLFLAGAYPLTMFFTREPAVAMIMSIYVTLGIFLLMAVRDPAGNRNLIAFAGWANIAHAAVMAVQYYL